MKKTHQFNYPVIITIIYLLGFLFSTGISLSLILPFILYGDTNYKTHAWQNLMFEIGIFIFIPLFLLILGLTCLTKLKHSFTNIKIDLENESILSKQFNNCKKIRFKDVVTTIDSPSNGLLIIKDKFHTILIPKEIKNYPFLYRTLRTLKVIIVKDDFENTETTRSLFSYILLIGLIPISLIPMGMFLILLLQFDGTSNSIIGLIILPAVFIGLLSTIAHFSTKYKFTKEAILKKSIFKTETIPYSNIYKMNYNTTNRILTLILTKKCFWKLKIKQEITIREPGNISIEHIHFELDRILNQNS